MKEKIYDCPKCHQKIPKSLIHAHLINHQREPNQPTEIRLPKQRQNEVIQRGLERYINQNRNDNRNHRIVVGKVTVFGNIVIFEGKKYSYDDLYKKNSLSFPEITIKDANKLEEENKKCMICLENYNSNEKVTALPCIHLFHTNCIKKWMEKKRECPICKLRLTQTNVIKKVNNLGNK